MKNVVWFLLGIIGGFVAAHFMNKDPRGHEMLASLDARVNDFTGALTDAYRAEVERESAQ